MKAKPLVKPETAGTHHPDSPGASPGTAGLFLPPKPQKRMGPRPVQH